MGGESKAKQEQRQHDLGTVFYGSGLLPPYLSSDLPLLSRHHKNQQACGGNPAQKQGGGGRVHRPLYWGKGPW